ncbi:MAG: thiamine diphosphokinase [Chloroflexota bacterium]
MDALILAAGDFGSRGSLDAAWPGWDAAISVVIAADGGARHARDLGVTIDRWVGDGDSIAPADLDALIAAGVPVQRSRPDKDESDTELAVSAAIGLGADGIVIVGALGGTRVDHTLANIALLFAPELGRRRTTIIDSDVRIRAATAPDPGGEPVRVSLAGRLGDTVSLLPWGDDVGGVTTKGLRYPLNDETLRAGPARGLSNVRVAVDADVVLRNGRLLIVESAGRLSQ